MRRRSRQSTFLSTSLAPAILAVALIGAASASAAMAQGAPSRPSARAARLRLAVVNGEAITLADIRESFGTRHSGHGGMLLGEGIIREVVGRAVEEKLLIQEGRRMGIPEEPGFEQDVEVFRDLQMLKALEDVAINNASEPSPAEIKAAYDLLPRRMHVGIIETRDREKASEAMGRVRIGEPFDTVARQMSIHQSRTRGGDLGWISWGLLDPVTEDVVMKTTSGQVSEPFAAEGSFRIVKVIEEEKAEPPPFAKVQDQIRAILTGRRKEKIRADLLASIRKTHPPVEDLPAIRRLTAAPQADPNSKTDPQDDVVLMKTASGLTATAGYARRRALSSGLTMSAAWQATAEDTLLIDEARRRFGSDPAIQRKAKVYEEERIRDEVERTAVLKDLELSDAEVRAFYDRDPNLFARPSSYHVRHIVLATAEEAEEVRRQIAAGADFAALTKEKSLDRDSADSGGDLGFIDAPAIAAGTKVPEGIFALKAGEVSGVIAGQKGHSVVQVLEIRKGETLPFEKVRQAVAQRVVIVKQKELRDAYVARLRQVSKITIEEDAIPRAVRMQEEQAAAKLRSTTSALPAKKE